MAKLSYAYFVSKDKHLEGTVVRNSTVSEELGRISYILSDKTGTLTKNEMVSTAIYCIIKSSELQRFMSCAKTFYIPTERSCFSVMVRSPDSSFFEIQKINKLINKFIFRYSKSFTWAQWRTRRIRSTKFGCRPSEIQTPTIPNWSKSTNVNLPQWLAVAKWLTNSASP